MKISQHQIAFRRFLNENAPLESLRSAVEAHCGVGSQAVRVAMMGRDRRGHVVEMETVEGATRPMASVFDYRQRATERTAAFNAVMLIPTGSDCLIGGHAGDATPSARLLASVCDNLVLHPNVVNASDINEQTDNMLYAEGSLITRLMMGTIGLRKVRQNRLLLVTEDRPEAPDVVDQTINCAEGARATLGVDIREVVVLEEGLSMRTGFSESGRVTGAIDRLAHLVDVLERKAGEYDAVALATKITPHMDSVALHHAYFAGGGANPWGGVEAVLTHTLSGLLNVPTAHAPTMSSEALKTQSWGVVEPRKAAEIISTTYLFCVLKGLHRAPRVVTQVDGAFDPSVVSAEDISALVIPDGCVGLPTLAACQQGVPVIAVRGNKNMMKNDLTQLPFEAGQLIFVENYLEAAGMLAALKAGVARDALARPMSPLRVSRVGKVAPAAAADKLNGHATSVKNGHTNGHALKA
ncbi:hypothetical protein Pla175_48090 [Pirellulimonas nuda]|uniref:DUF3326 domain-containing protein n=1 Tax=Pirellulimonas nuda TaxID=2528009 RepID=A0A518DIT0_9BACT|nr:DUF3326 domain-containing protein [Pirellulimonas nuda]QDU91387.1 hypothetical protein Pla175_48090 [Pirellulimonas nuda]